MTPEQHANIDRNEKDKRDVRMRAAERANPEPARQRRQRWVVKNRDEAIAQLNRYRARDPEKASELGIRSRERIAKKRKDPDANQHLRMIRNKSMNKRNKERRKADPGGTTIACWIDYLYDAYQSPITLENLPPAGMANMSDLYVGMIIELVRSGAMSGTKVSQR
ncbi:hypothetical protein B9Z65_7723 [Elsinoe australis]|uniref:Uncharacterized protein n=1 Tax=Elsinoe australis TaxID=40998 RepID=A0A2P8A0C8_9PEZI|nr:hypothetical protein B9Z65_7723 [Elsinoe australis]